MRTLASEGCIGGNFVKQQKIKFGRVSELQAFRFSVLKLKNTFQLRESVIWYTFGCETAGNPMIWLDLEDFVQLSRARSRRLFDEILSNQK